MINDKMVNEKIDATITALNELVAAIYLARTAQGETPKKEVPKIQVAADAVPFKTIMDLTLAASRAGHKALVREKLNEFGAAKIQDLSQENAVRYNTWITDLLK